MDQPCIDDVHRLLQCLNWDFNKAAGKHLAVLLPYAHVLGLWIEQVRNLLEINLKEADVHFPVSDQVLVLELFKGAENELERLGHDTLACLVYLA